MPCWRSQDCLSDKSALVKIEVDGLDDPAALGDQERAALAAAMAGAIASTCDVDDTSVIDLAGNSKTVTLKPGGQVSAFVVDLSGTSANELAARLYSSSFRFLLQNSTAGVSERSLQVVTVSLQPKKFELPATTTVTTTATTATRTTTAAPTTTAQERHEDIPVTTAPVRHRDVNEKSDSGASGAAVQWVWPLLFWALLSGSTA